MLMSFLINFFQLRLYSFRSNYEELCNQLENTVIHYICLPDELKFSAVVYSF